MDVCLSSEASRKLHGIHIHDRGDLMITIVARHRVDHPNILPGIECSQLDKSRLQIPNPLRLVDFPIRGLFGVKAPDDFSVVRNEVVREPCLCC